MITRRGAVTAGATRGRHRCRPRDSSPTHGHLHTAVV